MQARTFCSPESSGISISDSDKIAVWVNCCDAHKTSQMFLEDCRAYTPYLFFALKK